MDHYGERNSFHGVLDMDKTDMISTLSITIYDVHYPLRMSMLPNELKISTCRAP